MKAFIKQTGATYGYIVEYFQNNAKITEKFDSKKDAEKYIDKLPLGIFINVTALRQCDYGYR